MIPNVELLVLAASVPELLARHCSDDIGCGILATHLARLTSQRIFLEPVLGHADHVRITGSAAPSSAGHCRRRQR